MLAQLALAIIPLAASAAPLQPRGGKTLSCVNQMYTGAFTSSGSNGYTHLYGNVTQFHSDTQTNTFNETRLGLLDDGTIGDCGDCRSTQQFGFEVCQGPDRKAYDGLGNSPNFFYGHVLYTTDQADVKCLTASQPFNGSSLTVSECQYDYDNAVNSGQYFELSLGSDDTTFARLETGSGSSTYGINPDFPNSKLTLWDGPANGPFTYLGFKAPY